MITLVFNAPWVSSLALQAFLILSSPSGHLTASEIVVRLLSIGLLIAINAFFVAAEFSIVSVRRSRISQLVDAGDTQAKTVQDLQRSIDRLLSTTQIGITLSSLALGWIGESTMAATLTSMANQASLPSLGRGIFVHSLSVPIAFFLLAYLQIVLGELCPKSVALLYSERLSIFLGPPSLAIARFFNPFVWILNQSTRWLLKLVGIQYTGQGWYNQLTPEELQLIISMSTESTGLEAEERELLSNVFEFGEVSVEEVMVPRINITALSADATFQDLLNEVSQSFHSRYPVMGESLDDIRGMIYFKELAAPLANGELAPESPILPWVRPARFVPGYMPLSELLPLMQRTRQAMAMVVDEFGGTAGLVTIEDLIAEIIGDTAETASSEDVSIQILDEQTFIIQAQMNLEEMNERLNLNLPLTDEYQTLGGFLLYQWQKIPHVGEILHYNDCELSVVSAEGPRLHLIQVRRLELEEDRFTEKVITPLHTADFPQLDDDLPNSNPSI
ncbi:MAG: hemolysin family protein [Scytolyngbya sp. HA4215-MV1]|jgi:CBS domain containing-hemolysin-like protein|nr:hemolysin family protein [Scytolyngbya sp. HA4215-MV1]